jgi:hypothetical protein
MYPSPDVMGIISMRICWVGPLTKMELENAYTILVRKFEEKGVLART